MTIEIQLREKESNELAVPQTKGQEIEYSDTFLGFNEGSKVIACVYALSSLYPTDVTRQTLTTSHFLEIIHDLICRREGLISSWKGGVNFCVVNVRSWWRMDPVPLEQKLSLLSQV